MATHTGMELHGRDGYAISSYYGTANDRSMAATKPIRCGAATTCTGADDGSLYGGSGNDVVDTSTRDGSDTISFGTGIAYVPTLVSRDRTTTWSSRR
jgi:hypothetical protein